MDREPQTLAEAGYAFREAWLEFVQVAIIDPILKPLAGWLGVRIRKEFREPGAWRQG